MKRLSSNFVSWLSGSLLALNCVIGAVHGDDNVPILSDGLYQLQNHPDGGAAPPLYGLRLDELVNVSWHHDVFTFDFDDARSDVKMLVNGSNVKIFGTVFGGLDTGSGYSGSYSGLWDLSFDYMNVEALVPTDNDLVDKSGGDTGSITQLFNAGGVTSGTSFNLKSYAGDHAYAFRLGDEADDLGHRGFDGISGWGWLLHGDHKYYKSASDWLFTVKETVVPEPGTYLTLGSFLMVAAFARKRRRAVV